MNVERIGVIAAERRAIDDIKSIRIGGPGGRGSQAAKRSGCAADGIVKVKKAAYLIVDQRRVAIWRHGQHHAGNRGIRFGEGVVVGRVNHQLVE